MLSDDNLLRYNKHILLPEIDILGQTSLLEKHVILIGLGGLGCPIAFYLAASGIGKITIIDNDIIDISNLQRQILYTHDDIGKKKVDVAQERIYKLNPSISKSLMSSALTKISKENVKKKISKNLFIFKYLLTES